jgi:phosphate transport system substrate-binding protein
MNFARTSVANLQNFNFRNLSSASTRTPTKTPEQKTGEIHMANLKKNNDMAVSPIVATLVLIVVAVIGAVAVGTIMGTFSSDVSKQASSAQAGAAAQSEILIAGSTTLIPAELNLQNDFVRSNPGNQINVQGGGSSEGPQSVALGIADIGAVSSGGSITTAQNANANDPIYQNLYFTQIGGRGVVFIQSADAKNVSGNALKTDFVTAAEVKAAYENVVSDGTYIAGSGNFSGWAGNNVTMEQREAGSGTMSTAFNWAGLTTSEQANGVANAPINNGNAQMLAAVQAGTVSKPAFGFVDSGYAITGGVSSNTTASGIAVVGLATSTGTYIPTHANIKEALHDWYNGNAQDTTVISATATTVPPYTSVGLNYPQKLVGGLYWITKGSSPSAFTGNKVTTVGTSSASSVVTSLINFAKSPGEAAAFNNAGMYSMYDFM